MQTDTTALSATVAGIRIIFETLRPDCTVMPNITQCITNHLTMFNGNTFIALKTNFVTNF